MFVAAQYKVKPLRIYTGTFMTSLNGSGFSITLLRVVDTGLGPGKDMISLLDAAHETLGWTASVKPSTWASVKTSPPCPLEEFEQIPTSCLKS